MRPIATLAAIISGILCLVFIALFMVSYYDYYMERENPRLGDYNKAKWGFSIPGGFFFTIFLISGIMVLIEGVKFMRLRRMRDRMNASYQNFSNNIPSFSTPSFSMPSFTMPYFNRPVAPAPMMMTTQPMM